MHKYAAIAIFVVAMQFANIAYAGSKFMGLFWWPSHWVNQDFKPYSENGTDPHNSQWDDDKLSPNLWTPREWVANDGGSGLALIQKWYNTDILRNQYVDGGIPRLTVGPNFYHLSDAEKNRVTQTVDAVYQVTRQSPKMYYLEDFRTGKEIGYYTTSGLVLQ